MSLKKTNFPKSGKVWQRHALAQACLMAVASISVPAWALPPVDYTPGAAFNAINGTLSPLTQTTGNFWSTGYNQQNRNYQFGEALIESTMPANIFTSSLTGAGSTPINISNNSLLAYTYGNQNLGSGLSLTNLASVSSINDGQLALNLQIFSGITDDSGAENVFSLQSLSASATATGPSIVQVGKGSAALTLSGNTMGATVAINIADNSLSGATPSAYASTTTGASAVSYGGDTTSAGTPLSGDSAPTSTRGTTGSVNVSNLQSTFNAEASALVSANAATVTVSETPGEVLSSSITLNDNKIGASSTSNSALGIVQASASSSAFTGSVAVTNIQTNKIEDVTATQTASVTDGNIQADLRNDGEGETALTGSLNLNGNAVTAQAFGNTAGARNSLGNIAAGNAILFDGNADITGSTAPLGLGVPEVARQSYIRAGSTATVADLLINNVQVSQGNSFLGSINGSSMSSKVDFLEGGSINQSGNTQAATVSTNLAGNLISAGSSASVGNLVANAAIVNAQNNTGVDAVATVDTAAQSVTVGNTSLIVGSVSLNDNSITATAEGNVAASILSLKASTVSVGGNGGNTVTVLPSASGVGNVVASDLAASVISSQKNSDLTLTANNEASSVSANFNTQTGVSPAAEALADSQVTVSGNNLLSTASGNSVSNALNVSATNAPGLNAGLGNSQLITAASTITANAGFANALSVSITAGAVDASALSLNNNTQSAAAKGNTASNNLTVTATNASGLAQTFGGLFTGVSTPSNEALDANGSNPVLSSADLALVNAQANDGSTLAGSFQGSSTVTLGAVSGGSNVSVNGNQLMSSGSLNTANNTTSLNITNMSGMTAGLSSSQGALDSVATANTAGDVVLITGNASEASSLSLNSNTVSSAVSANTVSNSLSLVGTNASGRAINKYENADEDIVNETTSMVETGVAKTFADMGLANKQSISNDAATDFVATTVSSIRASVSSFTASALSVNDNRTTATSSGNNASNSINLAVSNLTQTNTGLASAQTMGTASFTASVSDTSIEGSSSGTGVETSDLSAAQVSVNNNTVKAAALGNVVTNSIVLSGTNATGTTRAFGSSSVAASSMAGMTNPTSVALANDQTSNGNGMSATVGSIASASGVFVEVGDVSAASRVSLADNTMASQVYNNSANNELALNVSNLNNMSAGLVSSQSVTATSSGISDPFTGLTAETLGRMAIDTGEVIGGSSLTAKNNTVSALLMGNTANNALSVNATNASGRNSTGLNSDTESASTNADFALVSAQWVQRSVMQANTVGNVNITAGVTTASAIALQDNSLTAYSSANNANNSLALNVGSLTAARAGLVNAQTMDSTVTNTASVTSGVLAEVGTLSAAQVSVTGNLAKATALGNVANNQLNVVATNVTAGTVDLDGSLASTLMGAAVDAGLALANAQSSNASPMTAINGSVGASSSVVLTAAATGAASNLTLSDNTLASVAFNNNATNGINLAVTNLSGMTAGLANRQSANGVAVQTAASTDGDIRSTFSGDVAGASSVVQNNNAITASGNVNYAGNSLTVVANQITGRNAITPLADGLSVAADLALVSVQFVQGDTEEGSSDFVTANVAGTISSSGFDLTASSLSVNANSVTANANANNGINKLAVTASSMNQATLGLSSVQGNSNANVLANAQGNIFANFDTVSAGNVSVNKNEVKSTAIANTASNGVNLSVTNATGSTVAPAMQAVGTVSSDNLVDLQAAADVMVSNYQALLIGTVKAETGSLGTASTVRLTVTDLDPGSAATLNGNSLTSSAYANSASNTSTVRATNLDGMAYATANLQKAQTATVVANTYGSVLADTPYVTNSTASVNNNQITSTALSNLATNTLDVGATNVTGRSKVPSLGSASLTVAADMALVNTQILTGTSPVTSFTNGVIGLGTDDESVESSAVSMNSNAISSYASANQASNKLNLAATQVSGITAGILSAQSSDGASEVTATTEGLVSIQTGSLRPFESGVGSTVAVNDNQIKSTALGNLANNALSVTTTNLTSTASLTAQASAATVEGGRAVSAVADFAVANAQSTNDSLTALTTGDIAVETSGVSNSSVTLSGNSVKSLAQANSASNDLNLKAGQQNGITGAVASSQNSSGAVSAQTVSVTGALQVATGTLTNAAVVMSDNTVSALAGQNEAFNSLTVSGSALTGRLANVSASIAGTASVVGADFAVMNEQTATGSVTASVNTGLSGISASGMASGNTLALSGNTVLASANANTAANTLSLSATNTLEASGVVNNVQTLSDAADVTATVFASSLAADTGASTTNAKLAVTDNQVKASATGNVANNALNASAANGIAIAGAFTNPSGTTGTPTFAVLNSQHTGTGSTVSSVINGFNMGGTQLSGALNGGSVAMTGNVFQSVAYGNSATNAIQVSALSAGLNTASASITNMQINRAAVNSQITGVNVQANGVNSSGAAGVNISGNSVMSMAVGNRAVNTVSSR